MQSYVGRIVLCVIKCGISWMAMMRLPRLRVRTYMVLVGVVAMLAWSVLMGPRSYEYYQRARIYSVQERYWREHAQRDLSQGNPRTLEARSGLQVAAYYAPLVRKYRRAMWRPWVPVDYEPPLFFPAGPPPAEEFDLQLISWGDGSGVPTSSNQVVIVGTDNRGLLHIRIFTATGAELLADTDETQLPTTQASAISRLKHELPGLLPPHVLTRAEKVQVVSEVISMVGQTPADIPHRPPDDR
jgi:hypothetical protein